MHEQRVEALHEREHDVWRRVCRRLRARQRRLVQAALHEGKPGEVRAWAATASAPPTFALLLRELRHTLAGVLSTGPQLDDEVQLGHQPRIKHPSGACSPSYRGKAASGATKVQASSAWRAVTCAL